jgi:hypothetical protein
VALVRLWRLCYMRLLDLRRVQLLNRRVVQNRPNRQGAGRDPSSNRTSVRIVLSVPLILFAHFSRPRAVSHEPDAQRIGS